MIRMLASVLILVGAGWLAYAAISVDEWYWSIPLWLGFFIAVDVGKGIEE